MFNNVSPLKMFFEIIKYKKCRNCGSKKIGDGEGTFLLTENGVIRTCKCGWKTESFKVSAKNAR